jgi:hypothetical protein
MYAGGGERPDGGVHGREAPVVGGECQELVLAEVAFHEQGRAELADGEPGPQIDDARLEAPLMADAELHVRCRHGLGNRFHLAPRCAERLFAEHVLAGLGGRDDLSRVMLVWRRQDDSLDIAALERVVEPGRGLEPGGLGRVAHRIGGLDAEHRPDDAAGGKLAVDDAAPPAQADDGRIDHLRGTRPIAADGLPVALAPCIERLQHGAKGLALVGEKILVARRMPLIEPRGDHALRLQRLEPS